MGRKRVFYVERNVEGKLFLFSSKHFLLVFIGPDAALLMHLIICSVGVKSFAHRTLLYFLDKMLPVLTHDFN